MKTFGNILWFLLGGFLSAVGFFLEGIIMFITIIFIPVGFQMFKLARFFMWPMGKEVVKVNPTGFKKFVNVLWAILGGWVNFLVNGLIGCLFSIVGDLFMVYRLR